MKVFIVLGSKELRGKNNLQKSPYEKGILLERQLRISYDKLYDPYDLDDLSSKVDGIRQ